MFVVQTLPLGSVKEQPGRWIGVEWDDVSRGRHNGVFKDVRYFQTEGDLPSATFVPFEKLRNGVSLVSAIQARYTGLQLTPEDVDDDEEMFVSTTSNKSKRIELVGKTKVKNQQRKTHLLQSVDVSGACITHTVFSLFSSLLSIPYRVHLPSCLRCSSV